MSKPSSNPFDLSDYLSKSLCEHPATEWVSVEYEGGGHHSLKGARQGAPLRNCTHAHNRAARLPVGMLATILAAVPFAAGVVAPAHAQTVPKSLEQGGTDAALKQRKNAWTIGVAGGQLSGTYMTLADELAEVLDDGDNLRVIPIVTHGAASNLDDLLYPGATPLTRRHLRFPTTEIVEWLRKYGSRERVLHHDHASSAGTDNPRAR